MVVAAFGKTFRNAVKPIVTENVAFLFLLTIFWIQQSSRHKKLHLNK
ncbi:hypothetical protein LEP1GSC195_2225 [Leptospira wolbachii serovar Codice str. CDC]|uniref:Uncharacterized protein n=1 Tax=Leptospira wolbachii serovar Codice str. CDC TaxID=1218599 RepID=R9A777_9LEPT|nr:hypothetical protein LEP1GSC195_2225 [Leptospira wolbachii serovar Codice str. CDC]